MKHMKLMGLVGLALALACGGESAGDDSPVPVFDPDTDNITYEIIAEADPLDYFDPDADAGDGELGQAEFALSVPAGYGIELGSALRRCSGSWDGGFCMLPSSKTLKYEQQCNGCGADGNQNLGFLLGIGTWENALDANGFSATLDSANDNVVIRTGSVAGNNTWHSVNFTTNPVNDTTGPGGQYRKFHRCTATIDFPEITAKLNDTAADFFGDSCPQNNDCRMRIYRQATARAAAQCAGLGHDTGAGTGQQIMAPGSPMNVAGLTLDYRSSEKSFWSSYAP